MEDGKDPLVLNRAGQTRVLPQRLLQLLVLFLFLCLIFSAVSIHMIRYFGVYSTVSPIRPNLLPRNGEELRNLDQWINPPSTLMHNLSDKELFGRALSLPHLEKYPFKRVPKIAFMFLTKGPLPLAPLWERFFKGNEGRYSIYIHSLPSFEADFPSSSVFYKRQTPSQVLRRLQVL
ncbi:UNVERIFIED_CONTAM: hypothetical protein Slati_1869600 [Sesamum latifolium]|uniref:Core-2/I-branching beta-1,6-N-acetylglucosaminyltransferase family protein n=1 Tax=Sesamum latifolium TaxID=2727402 RepID=A0AAW2WZN4_9LAMI